MARVGLSDSLLGQEYKPIKRGPFVDANGDLWLVYMQSSGSIIVRKSSDKGATWPTDGSYFFGYSGNWSGYTFDAEFDATNGVFYMLVTSPYPNCIASVVKFTISTTTFAAFSTGTGPAILGSSSGISHYAANLFRKSDGSFTVVHAGQNGSMTFYDGVYYTNITSAGAWGSRTLVSPSSSVHYGLCAAALGASNRVHIVYWAENLSGGTGAVYHRSLSGTTLDTAAQIGTLVTYDYQNRGMGFDSGSGYLWFSNANAMYRCTSGANPTWTAFSTSPSFGVSPDTPGTVPNEPIFYDTVNSLLRILFGGNNHTGYIFENHTSGTTWPNSQSAINTENSWVQQMSIGLVHDNNGTFGVGILYLDQGVPYYLFYALEAINYTETATIPSVTSVSSVEDYTPNTGNNYTESATIASKTIPSSTEEYTELPPLPLPNIGYFDTSNVYGSRSDISYNLGPHEDANGNWWFITLDNDFKPRVYKSSDKGITWDSGTSASATVSQYATLSACLDKTNGKLYVVGSDNEVILTEGYQYDLKIYVFDVDTHTWSRFDSGTVVHEVYYGGQYPPKILLQLSDGSFVLVYSGDEHSAMGADFTSCCYVKISSSGVWGTPVEIDAGGETYYRPQDAIVGYNDRVHIIFTGDDGVDNPSPNLYIYHRSLLNTTLDTTQLVAGPVGNNNGLGPGFTLGYVGGTHQEVLLCMGDKISRAPSTADPTFTMDSDYFVGATGSQVGTASRRVCFWYDGTNDKLYVVYQGQYGAYWGSDATQYLFWMGIYDYDTGLWNDGNSSKPTLAFPPYAGAADGDYNGYAIGGFGGLHEAAAQTFELPESRTITGLPLYSTHSGGPPEPYDGIYVELRQDSPTGTLLRTTDPKYTAYGFGTTMFFEFATPFTLQAGVTYCMVIKRGAWSNYLASCHSVAGTATNLYRHGSAWESNNGVWTAQPNDLKFGIPMDPNQKGWQWVRPTIDGFGFIWTDYGAGLYTAEYRFGAAHYIEAEEVASVTSITSVDHGPYTEIAEIASVTAISTDETYGQSDVVTIPGVTSITSEDLYHLGTTVDSATAASVTSLSYVEQYGNAISYQDSAIIPSITELTSDEIYSVIYVESNTIPSITSLTGSIEEYTTPQIYTDSATVAGVTTVFSTEVYTVYVAPTVSFTYEQQGGGIVRFYDTSPGTVTSWFWDFGDGTTSTEQNPVHTYATTGTYTVTLTINGTDSVTHTFRVHVSHTSQELMDGQIAIGTDGSFHWSIGGKWYTAPWAPSVVNAVPQDCVLGQVALGLDDSFHWYDGTEWHSFPKGNYE